VSNIKRLRVDFLTGLLASPGLTGTAPGIMTMTGSGFGNINLNATLNGGGTAIVSGTYLPVIINPAPYSSTGVSSNAPEIVWVYQYSANSTTANVLRAQEGSNLPIGGNWSPGVVWSHGSTTNDFGLLNDIANGDFPSPTISGQVLTSIDSTGTLSPVWATPSIPTNVVLSSPIEPTTIINTTISGNVTYDVSVGAIVYYTIAATGNVSLNITSSTAGTLNNLLPVGGTISIIFMMTNGNTPYYVNNFYIDGNAVNIAWQGGTGAPTGGDSNAVDVYSYTIIKTSSSPTYKVLASTNKFV